jgi:hypothetical protein
MFTERKTLRYGTMACAVIPGCFDGDALLKDLGVAGCRLESTTLMQLEPGRKCSVIIKPEAASGVDGFDIEAEVRWVREHEGVWEAGLFIVASPKGKFFQRYVDYLAYREAKGG